MLRRFLNLFSNMSRKARRSGKHEAARPSRKLKLFLEALDSRLVPTANSTAVVTGGTLFIVENVGGSADTIQQTSAFGGNYSITDSNGSFNFSGVTNISFNATQSGISVEFGNGVNTGYNTPARSPSTASTPAMALLFFSTDSMSTAKSASSTRVQAHRPTSPISATGSAV